MIELGRFSLVVGCAAALWAFGGGIAGAWLGRSDVSRSARRGVLASAAAAWIGCAALVALLVRHDYTVAYVWKYTSNSLDPAYSAAALWAGQEGSLLFWVAILGVYGSLALFAKRTEATGLVPHITWVIGSIQLFFWILLIAAADPFRGLLDEFPRAAGVTVREGNGLNPQLQNYWMLIHPPVLYLGYVGFAVPFAFSIAALVTGRLGIEWLRASRVWTMTCWTFLGFGILLGGRWAYVELGWGGYWAWDPVENASLMPWLTATAFIHSVIIEEQRGMLRRWNIFLILTTFLLSIFGTFLTRSGLLSSVHSFARSSVGDVFLYFMGAWAIAACGLFLYRYDDLAPKRPFVSVLSRESAFLFQNLFLLAICAAVFWGTMYPVFSKFFLGEEITVRAPYFNQAVIPIGLGLFFLIGAGPLIPWRAASWTSLMRNLGPAAALAFSVGAAVYYWTAPHLATSAAFGIGVFILATTFADVAIVAAARARSTGESFPVAIVRLVETKRRRYGGYLAHIGMALLLFGLAGNSFNLEREKYLAPGETFELAGFHVAFEGYSIDNDGHRDIYRAEIDLSKAGEPLGRFRPEISVYFPGTADELRNSEVAIHSSFAEDAYLVFAEPDGPNALIRLMINPLVFLFWTGGLVIVAGAFVALVPWRFPRAAASAALLAAVALAPPAEAYSRALGDRDPVSGNFICQCGCNLVLEKCDMPNCGSAGPLLDEIGSLRAGGADDAGILASFVEEYGEKILAGPPREGWHRAAWMGPVLILAAGLAILAGYLKKHRRTAGIASEPAKRGGDQAVEVEAALEERRRAARENAKS